MKPTQEQIIAWAEESMFYKSEIYEDIFSISHLATLAYEAGRKDENEACAKEVAAIDADGWEFNMAAIIRARREQ